MTVPVGRFTTVLGLGAGALLSVVVVGELEMSRLTSGRQVGFAVAAVVGGWGFLVAGELARRRRPSNPTGRLMVALGLAWLLAALQLADHDRLAVTIGSLFAWLWAAILAHLMLAFPSGRLGDRRARVLVISAYAIATLGELGWVLFADEGILYRSGCTHCALPLISAGAKPQLAEAFIAVQRISAAIVALLGSALLLSNWRRGTLMQRRALAPVLAFGALTGLLLAVSVTALAGGLSGVGEALQWPYEIALTLIPIAFLLGVLVTFLQRAIGVTRLLDHLDAARP